ncbi:hypothetical protein SPBR_01720 [Sporothrix brasiliensis 5110]|uniref:Uncharacterized protein n=1 Tax=Sporothrix brasiliensis 5110 TaxID=1398154 RepID=A0A0C2J3Y7_9PEZI|nr:uncharacterized protein SPBR_01720 [Sporothrix brasiliensis 5110]KIH91792.1 hypothetical protein SPBR_01720 [Sporothrix brasiliensis 5110]
MATMDKDTKQDADPAVDTATTGANLSATPVTPVTAKPVLATLDTDMTAPKSTPTHRQPRRISDVASPFAASPASPRSLEHIQAEHQYLCNNLHCQDARIRSLLGALSAVQAQLQTHETAKAKASAASSDASSDDHPLPLTTAEARKLRKSAGFIQSKIAAAERQEQLLVLRIGEVTAELQGRQWLAQLQRQRQQRQQEFGRAGQLAVGSAVARHGYVPLEVPQTPYRAPRDRWTPDHEYFDAGHEPFAFPQDSRPTTTTDTALPPAFVVSPVTPRTHAAMPAYPVSSSPASVTGGGHGGHACMSPMSPLAPVFEPGSFSFGSTSLVSPMAPPSEGDLRLDSAATPMAESPPSSPSSAAQMHSQALMNHIGVQNANDDTAVVDGDGGDDNVVADSDARNESRTHKSDAGDADVSDTASLPPEVRPRRGSHSPDRPTPDKQKRRSLPPVWSAWPDEER